MCGDPEGGGKSEKRLRGGVEGRAARQESPDGGYRREVGAALPWRVFEGPDPVGYLRPGSDGVPRSASLFREWAAGVADLEQSESLQFLMHVISTATAGGRTRPVCDCSSSTEEEEKAEAAGTRQEMDAGNLCSEQTAV